MTVKQTAVHSTGYPHIVKVEGVCGGEAVIEGTRIAVWHIVGYYYKVGMSVEEILAEWDYLTPGQVFSARWRTITIIETKSNEYGSRTALFRGTS